MKKRQRKKQLVRARKRGVDCMSDFFSHDYAIWAYQHRRCEPGAANWISTHEFEVRVALLSHPRRRWLTRREYARRKAQIEAEIAARKGAIRAKLETHNYTLAGWVPKRQSDAEEDGESGKDGTEPGVLDIPGSEVRGERS